MNPCSIRPEQHTESVPLPAITKDIFTKIINMKKLIIPALGLFLLTACGNGGGDKKDEATEQANKLEKEVLEDHDIAMPKSMRIPDLEKDVKKMLDSIATLPEKAKAAAAPLKSKLDSLSADLSYASMAMDKWMTEFVLDSFKKDAAKRIQYLTDEKSKVAKVKEAVLGALEKAKAVLGK